MKLVPILALVLLAGCARVDDQTRSGPEPLQFTKDPETGCEYVWYHGVGITPRLDASGKPMCRETKS